MKSWPKLEYQNNGDQEEYVDIWLIKIETLKLAISVGFPDGI
jgi:hypothetical protein